MAGQVACSAGCAYLVPTDQNERHLFLIVAGPANIKKFPRDNCVLVSPSTIREATYDQGCIFEIGEHPFFTSRSFVAYRHTKQMTSAQILAAVASGSYAPTAAFNPALLKRARDGLLASFHTPNWAKEFCAACP